MAEEKEIKLSPMSAEIFNYVKNNGGEASVPELVSATGRTSRSINANVTDLQKKGFIVRDKREVEDETITYVVLTDEGKAFNA